MAAEAALAALRALREETRPKRGRPKKGTGQCVSHRIGVRLMEEDHAITQRAAEIQRRNVSEFCRLAILDAAHRVVLQTDGDLARALKHAPKLKPHQPPGAP